MEDFFPIYKGIQKPLEFMGIRGRFLTFAAIAIGVSFLGFILFSIILGKLAGFIAMIVLALSDWPPSTYGSEMGFTPSIGIRVFTSIMGFSKTNGYGTAKKTFR